MEQVQDYLKHAFQLSMRDPLWKTIDVSPEIRYVLQTPQMQRLNHIKQLGPAYLLYPGAVHTRFSHSLGVFHLARRLLMAISSQNSQNTQLLTLKGVQTFLVAALLHDIGHFPYAHVLEGHNDIDFHEEIIEAILKQEPLKSILEKQLGLNIGQILLIIHKKLPTQEKEILFYRSVLSGALDPDKLDYLNRDAYYCGVPYGIQDIDFILKQLTIEKDQLCLKAPGVISLESILFSKYLMYKSVYWHKKLILYSSLMKKVVFTLLDRQVFAIKQLYALTDEQFYAFINGHLARLNIPLQFPEAFWNYQVLWQIPLSHLDRPTYEKLLNVSVKRQLEQKLYAQLHQAGYLVQWYDLVIEIPDSASFEVHFDILEEGQMKNFHQMPSVLSNKKSVDFLQNLQTMSIVCNRGLKINKKQCLSIMEKLLLTV